MPYLPWVDLCNSFIVKLSTLFSFMHMLASEVMWDFCMVYHSNFSYSTYNNIRVVLCNGFVDGYNVEFRIHNHKILCCLHFRLWISLQYNIGYRLHSILWFFLIFSLLFFLHFNLIQVFPLH